MAFWKSLVGYMTGASYRQEGVQLGAPASYASSPSVPINTDIALQLSAVWACARLKAETVGSMALNVYKVDSNGVKTPDRQHPLSVMFGGKVNRWQTKQEFFETITFQLVLHGNAYALKQYGTKGQLVGLIPLMAEQMQVSLKENGARVYKYTENGKTVEYSEEKIWHTKLFGNGIIGLSPLEYARNSIGVGVAAEKSVGKIYKNGGKPSGVLTYDKVLNEQQRKSVRENLSDLSASDSERLFVLEAGMKFEQVSLSPQDIELLQSRRFQIEDIARFFNVPSVLINDMSASTAWGSGIEKIVQGWYKLGLRPYLERYEASIKANLFSPEDRAQYDIEFDFKSLLRPDFYDRVKAGKEGVQGGLITPNEWRLEEGMPSLDGGDSLLVQQQMIKLENVGQNTGVVPNG